MASSIANNTVQDETFLPGQIFVFGGFALRANSLGHLEQIESYAPGRQVRFGSLNYTTDIRRDLIFDGFEPMTDAPYTRDEHDLMARGIAVDLLQMAKRIGPQCEAAEHEDLYREKSPLDHVVDD